MIIRNVQECGRSWEWTEKYAIFYRGGGGDGGTRAIRKKNAIKKFQKF